MHHYCHCTMLCMEDDLAAGGLQVVKEPVGGSVELLKKSTNGFCIMHSETPSPSRV
jgi:hypothetical protein